MGKHRYGGGKNYRSKDRRKSTLRRILIVCEGRVTEPKYFRSLAREISDFISLQIKGIGTDTIDVVNEAIRIRDKGVKDGYPYDVIWAVFDKDEFQNRRIEKAMKLGKENNINIAFSSPCFELWFLLHFEYIESYISRGDIYKKLSKYLKFNYEKRSDMYDILKDKQKIAIYNAKRLSKKSGNLGGYDLPTTSVYKITESVNSLHSKLKNK